MRLSVPTCLAKAICPRAAPAGLAPGPRSPASWSALPSLGHTFLGLRHLPGETVVSFAAWLRENGPALGLTQTLPGGYPLSRHAPSGPHDDLERAYLRDGSLSTYEAAGTGERPGPPRTR